MEYNLPFGFGGALVAIKTLLTSDPIAHADTVIAMIDAIIDEMPVAQPEQQPLTKAQRLDVFVKAEAAMGRDQNLSWRDALINETERAHGIMKGN